MEPSSRPPAPPGRVAAVDFGTVRIGVALSDPERIVASPHETYARRSPQQDADYFRRLAAEERVALLVVGLPLHLDGRESPKSLEARQFARWLHDVTAVPVELFDERMTSVEAAEYLRESGMSRRRRKARIDKLAAQILLTAYLERAREPGAGDQAPGKGLGIGD